MSITVGIYIGKKDRLIRCWYDMLPRGHFPILVKYCIQSYLKGTYFPLDSVCDPSLFRQQVHMIHDRLPTQRNVIFSEEDDLVYDWVAAVESGFRSEEIKNIVKETILRTIMEQPKRYPLIQRERIALDSPLEPIQHDRAFVWGNGLERRNGIRSYARPMGQALLKSDRLEVKEAYEFLDEQAASDASMDRDGDLVEERRVARRGFRNLLDHMG